MPTLLYKLMVNDPMSNPPTPSVAVGARKSIRPLIAPRDIYAVITSRCNLLCRHCYGRFGEPHLARGELSGDEWLAVFRQAADQNVFFVNIAGGEPTLHPDFPRIIDGLVDLDLHFILTTNGMATKACLEAIRRARTHILGLKVSLDGPTPVSHAELRVDLNGRPHPRAFDQTIRTAEYLRDHDISYTFATCLHRGNIDVVPEFEPLLLRLRPTSWFLATISPVGRAIDYYNEIFASDRRWSADYWEGLKSRLEHEGIYVRYIDMAVAQKTDGRPSPFTCPAATEFCEINSDGTVAPCPVSRVETPKHILVYENVREKSLAEIWAGPAFDQFRKWRGGGCEGCVAFESCGRCVAQSIQWWGDASKPPPYCVSKGELLGLSGLSNLKRELDHKRHELFRLSKK